MTIGTALLQGTKLLEEGSIAAPRLTAEVLLSHAIGCERVWLYAHSDEELRELWWIHYGRYLHERLKGRPTQQITGRQEFYGREFRVTPDVLIPRPETEHVIEAALERVQSISDPEHSSGKGGQAPGLRRPPRPPGAPYENARSRVEGPAQAKSLPPIIDIGAGSGAIAITLALELNTSVVGTDISPSAITVAANNARRLNANVRWTICDLGSAFRAESFDLVVSNPPYVPLADKAKTQREVRDYEPEVALYGGEDGFEIYRRLVPEAHRLLRPAGWLIMEIGYASGEKVGEMLARWQNVEIRHDLAGLPRVILAQRS
jgi:release factor glutamine methyltransferase